MATFDPTRLYSTLLNTGLQVKDNALYQVIHDLIAALATINKQTNTLVASSSTPATVTNIIQQLTEITDFGFEEFQIPNINSSVTNVVNNVNNTIQQISDLSSDFSALDDFQIPGPPGVPGPTVPYFIGVNEVFLVPIFKQAVFAMNIEVQGILEVDGFLIEVETSTTSEFTVTTTGNIDDLDFNNADIIRMNNASDSTIRGLKAGNPGQRVSVVSIGAGPVFLSHQNSGDGTPANRLINIFTQLDTPLFQAIGTAQYQYDAITSRWRMIDHHQGRAITYNPTWSGSISNPSIGNGTLTGTYLIIDQLININIIITMGSTTTFGSGLWTFSVPSTLTGANLPNTSLAVHTGVKNYPGIVLFFSSTTLFMLDNVTGAAWSDTAPFTWVNGDSAQLSIFYVS